MWRLKGENAMIDFINRNCPVCGERLAKRYGADACPLCGFIAPYKGSEDTATDDDDTDEKRSDG